MIIKIALFVLPLASMLYAGGEVFSIVISEWLFLCVFLLAVAGSDVNLWHV